MNKLGGVLALALLAGCSSTIDADDYVRSCAAAAECVIIGVGDVCDCSCEYSAINAADLGSYQDDRGGITCNKMCEGCAMDVVPVCENGICQAR